MVVRLQFAMKSKRIQKWKGHLYSWVTVAIYLLDSWIYSSQQSSSTHPIKYCYTGLSGYTPYTFLLFMIVYIMISVSTLCYLKHEVAQNLKFQAAAQKFIRFVTQYMIVQLTFMVTLEICITIVGIAYTYHNSHSRVYVICSIVFEYTLLFLPIIMPLSRLLDPDLRKKLVKLLERKQEQQPDMTLAKRSDQTTLAVGQSTKRARQVPERIQLAESNTLADRPRQAELMQNLEDRRRTIATLKLDEPKKADSQDVVTRRRTRSGNKDRARTVQNRKRRNSEESKASEQGPFMHVLSNQIRGLIMKRILCFLNLQEYDKIALGLQQQIRGCKKIVKRGKNSGFQDRNIYIQSALEMINMFGNAFSEGHLQSVSHKFYNMISYAQPIFEILMQHISPYFFREHDQEDLDLLKSLDINLNEAGIQESSNAAGGKSGEFFFFTYDNKFLLKTISIYEKDIFLKRLETYFWYVSQNSGTLIAKILGMFTFEGFETGPINFVLMKNVVKCNKEGIERIYDMKGSSYDRAVLPKLVLKQGNGNSSEATQFQSIGSDQPNLSGKVLKDMDFVLLEQRLNLCGEHRRGLMGQLQDDSNFLKQQGLMDYSLIVFKVNWMRICRMKAPMIKSEPLLEAMVNKEVSSIQHCYKSTCEEGVYYHIGIIDYLQTYNTQKVLEKYAKKVLKLNAKLDTSSQDPKTYQQRFMRFIETIL